MPSGKKSVPPLIPAKWKKKKETLDARRQQAEGTKNRLEKQMDTLDINDPFYEQKIADLQRRYDEQYSIIAEINEQQVEINKQLYTIRQEKLTGDQVYQLLLAFNQLYPTFPEIQQKRFMKAFIERVDLYPKKTKDGIWIRSITFNFPVPVDGDEVVELPLESQRLAETVALLSKLKSTYHIDVDLELCALDVTPAGTKASYQEIKDYVQEHTGLKVSCLYIAQVKAKHGIIEREYYNKPKTEGNRVPKCPPEMEKAIEDALRYFQMIKREGA